MKTIAFELVPPNIEDGTEKAIEEAHKVLEHSRACGIQGRIGHVMIPGLIAEEDDRPLEMKPKMDTLDFWNAIQPELTPIAGLCTQVTAFMGPEALTARLESLRAAGIEGVIFVGVPRTMADGEGPGVAPTDALADYQHLVENRGVILIPTRDQEHGRFNFKCERGATFGMTQLLYSDAVVGFLSEFARTTPHRPEILLSFGYVPKFESRVKLINWLIQDPGNEAVEKEQAFVAKLADSSQEEKTTLLVELYKRVIDGVGALGFPLSIHLEAPYGVAKPAFETFSEMLAYWAPDKAPV
ncbi:MAG: mycobacterial-type methylenetetrahydrofolate reductase [Egibacteraceae bacterium]